MKYILELSPEQASLLQDVCEIGARIGMYQLHDICRLLPCSTENQKKNYQEIYDLLWEQYLRYARSSSSDGVKAEHSNMLWDLYQVIRYKLSWDRNPNGEPMNVMFDSPLRTSKQKLAIIRSVPDEPVQKNARIKTSVSNSNAKGKQTSRKRPALDF